MSNHEDDSSTSHRKTSDKNIFCDDATHESNKVLLDIIKRKGFTVYDIKKYPIKNPGGNYLGDLTKIDVKGETLNGKIELNLFMKTSLRGEISLFSIKDLYKREIFTYIKLGELFNELQNISNVPKDEIFKMVKVYAVSEKQGDELLIMENMSNKGYITQDRMKCVSSDFAEKAVIALAKFHSLSYAMQKLKNDDYQSIVNGILSETPIKYSDVWRQFIENMAETTMNCVDTPEMKDRINNFVKKMVKIFPGYHSSTARSVICHGDYRANNLLVKEKNGKVVDLIPIDYQLLYHGPGINDFFYFVFASTSREYRATNLKYLKNLYRSTMKSFLKYFNLDIEEIYPSDEFDSDFAERLEYGLMISIQMLPTILASEHDAPNYADEKATKTIIPCGSVLKERMRGIIDDYVEFGIL